MKPMAGATPFDTVILRDAARLRELEPAWWKLFARAPSATPFQSPAWVVPWTECLAAERPVRLVVVSHGHELMGLLLLVIDQDGNRRIARLLGYGESDVLDCLIDPTKVQAVLACFSRAMRELTEELDALELTDLPEDTALARLDLCDARGACCICPRIPLDQDFEAYLRTLPSWLARNVRQGEARLKRRKEHSVFAEQASYDSQLDAFFDLHAARWQSRGLPGVLADEDVRRFHRRATPELLAHGLLELSTSFVEGEPVASSYVLVRRDASLYLSGFDPAFARDSLGSVVIARSIARAIRAGRAHYDFLRGTEAYKYTWGARDRSTTLLTLAGRGRHT